MTSLLDTGPLVALISKDDADHGQCVEAFQALTEPPLTCWPVITEAAWLLRHHLEHVETMFDFAVEGVIVIQQIDVHKFALWLNRFFASYHDQTPQLADAALMYLAEQTGINTILTLDRRDFGIYRTLSGRSLTILP